MKLKLSVYISKHVRNSITKVSVQLRPLLSPTGRAGPGPRAEVSVGDRPGLLVVTLLSALFGVWSHYSKDPPAWFTDGPRVFQEPWGSK